jgi:alkanesulfonate monooxygenase SsuD/methylene tetrahydromethanopterin reductase-like flavin-dependent oxidoreductase (luciferase family)
VLTVVTDGPETVRGGEEGAMQVGVGLPAGVPGAPGELVVDWARRADSGPFSSVGVIDRIAYGNYDPFLSLAAAAAVTTRVRLCTMVVIGPLRSPAMLTKQAASLDALSGGRLTLGVAIGARHEDYEVMGIDHRDRGERFDRQLAYLREAFQDGGPVGPRPAQPDGPALLVGGSTGRAFARMARYGDGYVHGGGPPRAFAGAASRAWAAWTEAGRPGRPPLWGQAYYALGGEAEAERGAAYLRDYYAFTGPFAERIAAGNLTSPQMVKDLVRGYEEAGCDHLVLLPTVADMGQLDRLADVLA